MLKLLSKYKNYFLASLLPIYILVVYELVLYREQEKKEALSELFIGALEQDMMNQVLHYRSLKEIDCSLRHISVNEKELLIGLLRVNEENISSYLNEDYVSDRVKSAAQSALEHIPLDCRTET